MSKLIVFGNEKGGSGKTTTAFHIAIVLIKNSYKTLTIDADVRQKSFTRYLENRKQTIEQDKLALGIPEIIVHRSDLFICFCKLIDDLALTINSFNKKPLPLNKLIYLPQGR